ncbi:MAG: hypothetical protein ABA06_00085 [Parcubacteria bacterium C7867-001]|nr:MAG: hypothetical protein ABA06_00085 [Parcubacteria bacterium C7867-001]
MTRLSSRHTVRTRGFTLLEILLVVAAIAILAGIVIVAINPAQQLADTRDAQRRSDVDSLASAISQYVIKHGSFPSDLPSSDGTCSGKSDVSAYGICAEDASCSTGFSLDAELVTEGFIAGIPSDPSEDNADYSGYSAFKDGNRVTVCAPLAENDTISSKR